MVVCAVESRVNTASDTFPLAQFSRLLFVGDSITAIKPEDPTYSSVVHRYVTIFETLLRLKHPGLEVTIISKGVSGDTVEHLRQRWRSDVLEQKPDLLFVLIGINDSAYLFRDNANSPEQYTRIYDELLMQTKQELPATHIVLMTPFLITRGESLLPGSDNAKLYSVLSKYVDVVKKLGSKHSIEVIDLDAGFRSVLKYEEENWLAPEPVHPGERGKIFIALKLLEYLENDFHHIKQ